MYIISNVIFYRKIQKISIVRNIVDRKALQFYGNNAGNVTLRRIFGSLVSSNFSEIFTDYSLLCGHQLTNVLCDGPVSERDWVLPEWDVSVKSLGTKWGTRWWHLREYMQGWPGWQGWQGWNEETEVQGYKWYTCNRDNKLGGDIEMLVQRQTLNGNK